MPLEKWQSEYGQDKGSIIANPKLKNGIPQSGVVKKIGFVPFDTSDAGVRGGMKKRAAEILDGYEFPPDLNLPKTPLWTKAFFEDFGDVEVGETTLEGQDFHAGRRYSRYVGLHRTLRPLHRQGAVGRQKFPSPHDIFGKPRKVRHRARFRSKSA